MLVGEGLIGGLLVVSAAELCWVDAGWAHCALLYCCCAITRSLHWEDTRPQQPPPPPPVQCQPRPQSSTIASNLHYNHYPASCASVMISRTLGRSIQQSSIFSWIDVWSVATVKSCGMYDGQYRLLAESELMVAKCLAEKLFIWNESTTCHTQRERASR